MWSRLRERYVAAAPESALVRPVTPLREQSRGNEKLTSFSHTFAFRIAIGGNRRCSTCVSVVNLSRHTFGCNHTFPFIPAKTAEGNSQNAFSDWLRWYASDR